MPSAASSPAEGPRWDERRGSGVSWLLAALAVAVAVRLVQALRRGLVLDEFHTLHHASAPDVGRFFGDLVRDNHPPLAFWIVGAVRRVVGDSELALRLPALAFGALAVCLTWRLARRAASPAAAPVAAALVAFSSLHVDVSAQVRMYALHALAVAGALDALVSFLESRRREEGLWLVFWCTAGAHTHYYFLHYVAVGALAIGAAIALTPHERPAARALPQTLLLVLALSTPWYVLAFREQLLHGLPPGMSRASLTDLAESYVHLLFTNVRIAGDGPRLAFIACGGLALLLGVIGFVRLWRERVLVHGVALPLLLAAVAYGTPLWCWLAVQLSSRAGFNWLYLVPSVPAHAILVGAACGAGRARRTRHAAVGCVLVASFALAILNALSVGTEDYRGAVRTIVEEAAPGDAVIAVEWQPPVFPQGLAWEYYASRLADGRALPRRVAIGEHYHVAEARELAGHDRVFVLRRSLPEGSTLLQLLRREYEARLTREFGYGLWVDVFER